MSIDSFKLAANRSIKRSCEKSFSARAEIAMQYVFPFLFFYGTLIRATMCSLSSYSPIRTQFSLSHIFIVSCLLNASTKSTICLHFCINLHRSIAIYMFSITIYIFIFRKRLFFDRYFCSVKKSILTFNVRVFRIKLSRDIPQLFRNIFRKLLHTPMHTRGKNSILN